MKSQLFKIFLLIFLTSWLLLKMAEAQKITITPGSNLVLNNSVSLVVLNGAVINNGTVVPGNSSFYFRGSDSAALLGTSAISLNNLYADQSTTVPLTLRVPVAVAGTLGLATGTSVINTNNLLTLRSTAVKTARVAIVPLGAAINGKVTVERFIQGHRSWRLITAPLQSAGAPTIKTSWQEDASAVNENPHPGYGTHITGATAPVDGFDLNASRNASCKEYIGGNWLGIPNTDVQKITAQPGYMLFVRGSRANVLSQGINAVADNTILRATGNLNVGNVSYPVDASGYTLIGNPYASPIDFSSVTRSDHVANTFYVWDPLLTGSKGLGGYVTVSYNGTGYDVTSAVSTVNQFIQSGSAFLVASDGNGGSITIKESDKSDQSRINVPRPAGLNGMLRAELYAINADSTTTLYDAVLAGFGDRYDNAIDLYDAPKLYNGAENVAILRDHQYLSIERRQGPDVNVNDTVFFSLSSMAVKNYQFIFSTTGLQYPNTVGLLKDNYLNKEIPLNLSGNTVLSFGINANPASAAANRFMFILKNTGVLAGGFTALSATGVDGNIVLNWQLATIVNAAKFEVERSVDGRTFNRVAAADISGFRSGAAYRWVDVNPGAGLRYYRIKAISNAGEIKYSQQVQIETGSLAAGIVVHPNLITGNSIVLQLNRQAAGLYQVQLKNIMGQPVYAKQLQHSGGNSTVILLVNRQLPGGTYLLEITSPGNGNTVIKLLKE